MSKKLEKNEITRLKELQDSYNSIIFEFGNIEIEKQSLLQRIRELESSQKVLFESFNKNNELEKKLAIELSKKYGEGRIDLDKGEII